MQLHGQESAEYCNRVGYPIIKAYRVSRTFDVSQLEEESANLILCDSYVPGSNGGTGVTFDWLGARNALKKIRKPVLVAGGLTPQNVAHAIHIMNPAGVDVSGGVETNGIKDAEKIARFIKSARAAEGGYRNAK